jgi:16S rRNA processing protein RimM
VEERPVIVGEVASAYGVKGWVKIHSHTEPPGNILRYAPWVLAGKDGAKEYKVLSGRVQGAFVLARLEGVDDRDQALKLKACQVMVSKDCFPPAEPGHYYWADLEGLRVVNLDGVELGAVAEMMATGANDVMVVAGERERLIPFVIGQFVKEIKLDEGVMLVDWDADF